MCNPGLTKYMQENPDGIFLELSSQYLGLGHGDTEADHPYVQGDLTAVHKQSVQPVPEVSAPAPVLSAVQAVVAQITSPISWAAQHSLLKCGRMNPNPV